MPVQAAPVRVRARTVARAADGTPAPSSRAGGEGSVDAGRTPDVEPVIARPEPEPLPATGGVLRRVVRALFPGSSKPGPDATTADPVLPPRPPSPPVAPLPRAAVQRRRVQAPVTQAPVRAVGPDVEAAARAVGADVRSTAGRVEIAFPPPAGASEPVGAAPVVARAAATSPPMPTNRPTRAMPTVVGRASGTTATPAAAGQDESVDSVLRALRLENEHLGLLDGMDPLR
jgi:hypothetical protein